MLRKNNFFLYILVEFLFLFFITIIIPTLFLKEKPGIYQTSFNDILPLNTDNFYIQSFVSNRDNINSISVFLKNANLESSDLVDLEILNKDQESLQYLVISGLGIEDPGWVRFKFPPINSKIGDSFYLKITSNSQKNGHLYIYGDKNTKNINFKTTFVTKNIKESFKDNLNQQITNFKSRNIFQSAIYLFLLILANIFIFS